MNRRLLFPASNRVWQQLYRVSPFSHDATEHPASITLLLVANGLVRDVQVYSQMKLGATLSLVLLALVFTPCFGQTPGNLPSERKYPIVRLPPTAFSELPKNLVTELERRGCTVPQTFPPDQRSDRKSVGEGKRVNFGGRRIIKKKKKKKQKKRNDGKEEREERRVASDGCGR